MDLNISSDLGCRYEIQHSINAFQEGCLASIGRANDPEDLDRKLAAIDRDRRDILQGDIATIADSYIRELDVRL